MHVSNTIKLKVVFIGDDGVGKTSIAKRYIGMGFDTKYKSTIGADFYVMRSIYDFGGYGRYIFYWMIWDLAGQKYFDTIRPIYYDKARAAIVVFDLSRPKTFRSIRKWIIEFWKYSGGKYPFIIIGNKRDLRGSMQCLPYSAGEQYAKILSQQIGFEIPYVETSAKTGENIREAFKTLARTILRYVIMRTQMHP